MVPSLPIELPRDTRIIHVADPLPCAMVRFGWPCGNDAQFVLVCTTPGRYGTTQEQLIPVCGMCVDDAGGGTWIEALERLGLRP